MYIIIYIYDNKIYGKYLTKLEYRLLLLADENLEKLYIQNNTYKSLYERQGINISNVHNKIKINSRVNELTNKMHKEINSIK